MQNIFNDFEINVKKSLVSLLIKLSEADMVYMETEIVFIKTIGIKMGFTVDEIKEIKHHPESFDFELPDNMEDRMLMLYNLVYLIRVDGDMNNAEKELLKKLGLRLYLNPALLDDILFLVDKYNGMSIPREELQMHILKYQN